MPTAEALRATEAAFVEDVCRHPDDDAPRLILADWLDEHGQAKRAEFIREQIRLARLGDLSGSRRERELLSALRRSYFEKELPPCPDGAAFWHIDACNETNDPRQDAPAVYLRRGFIEAVTLTVGDFSAHAAALFRAAPVRRVTFSDRGPAPYPGRPGGKWWWWPWYGSVAPSVAADSRRVPRALWNLLEVHERDAGGVPLWCSHRAALDALSAACLLYGRRAAWPCPSCGGGGVWGLALAQTVIPRPCPACAGRGHTVEEG